jgi:hypothetical protein
MQRVRIQAIALSAMVSVALVGFIGVSPAAVVAAPQQQQTTPTPQATVVATDTPHTTGVAPTQPGVQTTGLLPGQITDAQSGNLDGEPGNAQPTTNGVVTNLNGQASNVQASIGSTVSNQPPLPQNPAAPVIGVLAVLLIGAFVLLCSFRVWRDTMRESPGNRQQ